MTGQLRWLVISGAVLIGVMAFLFLRTRPVESGSALLPVLYEVGAFTVTNQAGHVLDPESLRGRPWAIDLIFTRCPGPCATLTGVLRAVQEELPPDSSARLMSVTSDPEFDTPKVLAAYAAKHGADSNRWHFVTASKADIRHLVTKQLRLVLEDIPEDQRQSPEDLFLHSTLIMLMDGRGRLRSVVEGLQAGAADKVVAALKSLEREGEL